MQPLVPLVFHNLPSLYPPSFRRNDFLYFIQCTRCSDKRFLSNTGIALTAVQNTVYIRRVVSLKLYYKSVSSLVCDSVVNILVCCFREKAK